jgi:5-methylcytosine-specific restriction endonuclease McrA
VNTRQFRDADRTLGPHGQLGHGDLAGASPGVDGVQRRMPRSTRARAVDVAQALGEDLLQLSGLLRPLIQRRWAAMVAQLNRLEESQLEAFLFGADRTPTARIRAGLWEIQGRRCFYCGGRFQEPTQGHVDHFIPWSRCPDDGLDNLVVADKRCNGLKSNSLAASEHLVRWARRVVPDSAEYTQFADLAEQARWDRHAVRSLSVVRAIYLRLPSDARLWLRGREFIAPDSEMIGPALT